MERATGNIEGRGALSSVEKVCWKSQKNASDRAEIKPRARKREVIHACPLSRRKAKK